MDQIFLYSTSLSVGGSVLLLLLAAYIFYSAVPPDDRQYMDPLPFWLRFSWPLIRIIKHYISSNLSLEYLTKVEDKIQKTGISYLLTAEEFVAVRIVSAMLQTAAAVMLMAILQKHNILWPLGGMLLGFYFPEIWLKDTRQRREKEVIQALPVYLDFITMAVEAGLNFTGALNQAMQKGPRGALYNEFGILTRDIRSGLSRADALHRMSDRLGIKDVTTFIRAVVQAERLGSSMKKVLQVQSEQRRNERFQRAEKMAMEAPIKLVAPLIMFIFPVTFIVLGFPIVMKFISEGLL